MAARCTGAADDEAGDRTSKMADRRLATSAILFLGSFGQLGPGSAMTCRQKLRTRPRRRLDRRWRRAARPYPLVR